MADWYCLFVFSDTFNICCLQCNPEDEYSVVGFVVLACLSLGYYYFTRLLFRLIFPVFKNRFFLIYFVIALTGLIYLTFRGNDPSVQFYLPVLIWLIVYT